MVELQCAPGVELPAGASVAAWIEATLAHAPSHQPGEISLRLVDADESQSMNEKFRHRDAPTNVLAFPADELPGIPDQVPSMLGDLVICVPVMQAEAAAQGKTEVAHFAHLVVHGTLHLLGLDHQSDTQALFMEGLETEILQDLGFPDPYGTGEHPREAAR
ncbi:MAG: rRNA maturation RNase YbeY [Gammaproteobacteria bacterium]